MTIYSGSCGRYSTDSVTWELDTDTGVLEISGTGQMDNYTSSSFGYWKDRRGYITSVIIGSGVTHIGSFAFYACSTIKSVTFEGNTAPTLGNRSFDMAQSSAERTTVTIYSTGWASDNLFTSAIKGSTGFTTLTYKTLSSGSSGSCGDNANWEFDPDTGVLRIYGTGATYDYTTSSYAPWYTDYGTSITNVVIEEGITYIGNYTFYNHTALTSVSLPDTLTTINRAFQSCSALTSINIPSSVTTIGNYAFYYAGLTSISIPDSVTTLGEYAFSNCRSATTITIGKGVTIFPEKVFYACPKVTTVNFLGDQPTLEKNSFQMGFSSTSKCTATVYSSGWASDDVFTSTVKGNYTTLTYERKPGVYFLGVSFSSNPVKTGVTLIVSVNLEVVEDAFTWDGLSAKTWDSVKTYTWNDLKGE